MSFKNPLAVLGLAVILLAAGCGKKDSTSQLPPPTGVMGTGILNGQVILRGKAPKPTKINMDADPLCQAQHPGPVYDESVVVDSRGHLANVLVYVSRGAAVYAPPAKPVTLIQKGCLYQPHVFGVQVNQALDIFNEDPTLHNVHAIAVTNEGFNVGQRQNDMTEQHFSLPEVPVKLKCDVHGWMTCFGGVFSNPFFSVTDKEGAFKIKGLPAGDYTVTAWQEKYGFSAPQKVSLGKGQTRKLNFSFTAR